MKRPMLFVHIRPEDAAADNEYEAVMSVGNIEMIRLQACEQPLPIVDPSAYAAIILGGGPATVSDPADKKPAYQTAFEPWLYELLRQIVHKDIPFLGLCYAPSAIVAALKDGEITKEFSEPVGSYTIELTDAGMRDPIFVGLPHTFDAFAGHKDSVKTPPEGATVLARSNTCPVQAYRMGKHVYAFQFHPELDPESLALRIDIYRHMGYFEPSDAESLIAWALAQHAPHPQQIVKNFIERYQ